MTQEQQVLKRIEDLLPRLGTSQISPSAYDTAQVSLLQAAGGFHPVFPRSGTWLLAHQHSDGSWGGSLEFAHDRCICTLAAVIALTQLSRRGHLSAHASEQAAARGVTYLASAVERLQEESAGTAAFELLFPQLLEHAARLGIELRFTVHDRLYEQRARKIRLIAGAGTGPSVHSAEAFEVFPHGLPGETAKPHESGIGCSPSATAHVLGQLDLPSAMGYLRHAVSSDGCAPTVYPFDVYERAWVLAGLQRAGVDLPGFRQHIQALAQGWQPWGTAMASSGMPGEGDSSAVVYTVLRKAGLQPPTDALETYRTDKGYMTYPAELDSSVSCNAHMLTALRAAPSPNPHLLAPALEHLRRTHRPEGNWSDKWHISPHYSTAAAVEALQGLDGGLCRAAVAWTLRSQNSDGSWGVHGGNREETAYAITTFLTGKEYLDGEGSAALIRGVNYLFEHIDPDGDPELWIGKALYAPTLVIQGAVLSALWYYLHQAGPQWSAV